MKKPALLVLVPLLYGFTSVPPEVTTKVTVSNTAVNRITCNEAIRDVVYSKEKPVEIKVNDRNIFLKLLMRKEGEKTIPAAQEVDMYVVCGDAVYSLLLAPGDLPAQSLVLDNPSSGIKKNVSAFRGMSHEEKLIRLLRMAYTETFAEGITVKDDSSEPTVDYPGASLKKRRKVVVEGEGLALTEYLLTPASDVEVRETDFLKLAAQPLMIALDKNRINANEPARLFVIESSLEVRK